MTRSLLALTFALSAIAATAQTALPDAPGLGVGAPAPVRSAPSPSPSGPTIVFDTSMGRMTCQTFQNVAPNAVANFIGLAEGTKDWTSALGTVKHHGQRFYDGLTFHRVIPGFMVQGGDPIGDGTGDPGYFFDDEISPSLTFSVAGRLAMANSCPNTNGSQFFITEAPQPDLDGHYTIFGQCDAHTVLLVASIARIQRDSRDKPLTPVLINHVTIVSEGQPMPPLPAAPATSAAPATVPAQPQSPAAPR